MERKPLYWIASSLEDLKKFPDDVQDDIGHALDIAQSGDKHPSSKPLKGIGSGVYEIVENYNTDTYRAVYTVHFEDAVYVLHCFQKKSKKGIQTPKQEIDLIKKRLLRAIDEYKAMKGETL